MITEKKEIVYNNIERFAVIVAEGVYRDMKYVCLNRGIHPCAYVMCSQEFLDKHVTEHNTIKGIYVHGGITYVGNAFELLGLEDYDSPCFGWDYGHAGDWEGYMTNAQNISYGHKKYTTDMLVSDCMSAIDQYYDLLESEKQVDGEGNQVLDAALLKKIGFTSVFGDVSVNDDDAFHIGGNENGKKWRIYVDLQSPSLSYALNSSPRKRYEGEIATLKELKEVVALCRLPLKINV